MENKELIRRLINFDEDIDGVDPSTGFNSISGGDGMIDPENSEEWFRKMVDELNVKSPDFYVYDEFTEDEGEFVHVISYSKGMSWNYLDANIMARYLDRCNDVYFGFHRVRDPRVYNSSSPMVCISGTPENLRKVLGRVYLINDRAYGSLHVNVDETGLDKTNDIIIPICSINDFKYDGVWVEYGRGIYNGRDNKVLTDDVSYRFNFIMNEEQAVRKATIHIPTVDCAVSSITQDIYITGLVQKIDHYALKTKTNDKVEVEGYNSNAHDPYVDSEGRQMQKIARPQKIKVRLDNCSVDDFDINFQWADIEELHGLGCVKHRIRIKDRATTNKGNISAVKRLIRDENVMNKDVKKIVVTQ